MTDQEAYAILAIKVRETISAEKMKLYRRLRQLEELDELKGYDLVRAAGERFRIEAHIGDSTVTATSEQADAFKIYRNQCEWRAYIDEVKELLGGE